MSLDRLLGTWSFTMRHSATTQPVSGQQRYERVLDGAFVILHWTYDHPDFPDAIALLDERTCHYFDVRGITRVFDVTVDDTRWALSRAGEDFWQRSETRFVGTEAMAGVGENSYDGGATWQHDYSIQYVRVGAG
jgi:hypothetical protein